MSSKAIALTRKWFEEVWNQKNTAAIHELMAPDCVACGGDGIKRGPKEFVLFQQQFLGAFPDLRLEIDNIVSHDSGEWVALRWTATGTHQGDHLGIPASGRSMSMSGISLVRIRDERFVEGCDAYDQAAMMAQLQPL